MIGCVSRHDFEICHVDVLRMTGRKSAQRSACLCDSAKTELFPFRGQQCPHQCLYCFWKHEVSEAAMKKIEQICAALLPSEKQEEETMEFTIETFPEDITVKDNKNTTVESTIPAPQPVEEPKPEQKPEKETKEMEKMNLSSTTPYKRIRIGEGNVVYDANVTVILTAPANNVEMFFEVKTSKGRNGAFDAVNKFIRKNVASVDFVTTLPQMKATWKNGQPVKGGYFPQKNTTQQQPRIWSSQDFIAAQEDMKASPKAQQKAPVQPQPTPAPIVQPSTAAVTDISEIKDLIAKLGGEMGNGFERVLTLVGTLNERIDKLEAFAHTSSVKPASATTTKKKVELQAELEAALAEIEQLKNNRLDSTNAELEAEVLRLKAENKTLQGAVEKMRALEEQNKVLEAENKALQGAANANVKLKAENEHLKGVNAKLEAANERLTKDMYELEAENQALQSEVYDLRQDLEKVTVATTVTEDKSAVNDDKATVANDTENVTSEEEEFKALDPEAIIQRSVKKGFTGMVELKDAPLLEQLSTISAVANLSGHNSAVETIESIVNLYGIIKMLPHPFNDVIKYLAGVVNKKKSYVVEFNETSIVFENGDSLNLR